MSKLKTISEEETKMFKDKNVKNIDKKARVFLTSMFSKLLLLLCFGYFSGPLSQAFSHELNDVREQLWLSGASIVHASYTYEEAVAYIKESPDAVKNWASNTTPKVYCSLIYNAPWGRIWSLASFHSLNALFVRDVVIPIFNENDYILIPFWSDVIPGFDKALIKNAQCPQNFFFLGNSDDCTEILRAEDLQAFTVSHNAFIDSKLFSPYRYRKKKIYEAVYFGRCRPQKRLHLASAILPELLVVTDSGKEAAQVVSGAKKIVYSPPPRTFSTYMNQAHCGIILSESEGGSYVTIEYLYSGLPVVSTQSTGGRDAYFDEVTAVIVDDTPEGVQAGVALCVERDSNPWEIRRRALEVSNKMLDTLAYKILLPIFEQHQDPHARNPRGFIDNIMNDSTIDISKGRTVFQPEEPTHETIEKIIREQNRFTK